MAACSSCGLTYTFRSCRTSYCRAQGVSAELAVHQRTTEKPGESSEALGDKHSCVADAVRVIQTPKLARIFSDANVSCRTASPSARALLTRCNDLGDCSQTRVGTTEALWNRCGDAWLHSLFAMLADSRPRALFACRQFDSVASWNGPGAIILKRVHSRIT